jgi:hypothetical protein
MLKPSIVTSVTLDLPGQQPMQIRPAVIDGRPISGNSVGQPHRMAIYSGDGWCRHLFDIGS